MHKRDDFVYKGIADTHIFNGSQSNLGEDAKVNTYTPLLSTSRQTYGVHSCETRHPIEAFLVNM